MSACDYDAYFFVNAFQAPSQSMKLKELKEAVEAQSAILSDFSCRREALSFLKRKVYTTSPCHLAVMGLSRVVLFLYSFPQPASLTSGEYALSAYRSVRAAPSTYIAH